MGQRSNPDVGLVRPCAALAVLLALAAGLPAHAASALEAEPGAVGVEASYSVTAETFSSDPAQRLYVDESDRDDGTDGRASVSYNYPPAPPPEPGGCSTSCATHLGAHGSADVRDGLLRAYARGDMQIDDGDVSGLISSRGEAIINDTITLSDAATVVLRGRVSGAMHATNSHSESQGNDPRAVVDADILLRKVDPECDPSGEICDALLGGLEHSTRVDQPGSEQVDESFELPIDLPAGTSAITAAITADIDYQVFGENGEVVTKTATVDFASSLRFEVELPADVTASSGSGLLPLVGADGPQDGDGSQDGAERPAPRSDAGPEPSGPPANERPSLPPADDTGDGGPDVRPARMRPFPAVWLRGRFGPRMTRIPRLVVRGPRRALVAVRCRGSRRVCPIRTVRRRIPHAQRLRMGRVQRTYRPGALLQVRVTDGERIGRYTGIRILRDRAPRRVERCLKAGTPKPVPCEWRLR